MYSNVGVSLTALETSHGGDETIFHQRDGGIKKYSAGGSARPQRVLIPRAGAYFTFSRFLY